MCQILKHQYANTAKRCGKVKLNRRFRLKLMVELLDLHNSTTLSDWWIGFEIWHAYHRACQPNLSQNFRQPAPIGTFYGLMLSFNDPLQPMGGDFLGFNDHVSKPNAELSYVRVVKALATWSRSSLMKLEAEIREQVGSCLYKPLERPKVLSFVSSSVSVRVIAERKQPRTSHRIHTSSKGGGSPRRAGKGFVCVGPIYM